MEVVVEQIGRKAVVSLIRKGGKRLPLLDGKTGDVAFMELPEANRAAYLMMKPERLKEVRR